MFLGDPLETIWKNCIFGLCGVTNFIGACSMLSSQAQKTNAGVGYLMLKKIFILSFPKTLRETNPDDAFLQASE